MKLRKLLGSLMTLSMLTVVLTGCNGGNEDEPVIEGHVCQHVCEVCHKCKDYTCKDKVCKKKCDCEQTEPTPEQMCEVCGKNKDPFVNTEEYCQCKTSDGKYIICDSEGNYGGTKKGIGSPLNGEYDVEDDIYYARNDFFNAKSTETRTILPRFRSYQQRYSNTDGIACLIMALNYYGIAVDDSTEQDLMNEYKALNGKDLNSNISTLEGMEELICAEGFKLEEPFDGTNSTASSVVDFTDYMIDQIEHGNIVLVRYQDGDGSTGSSMNNVDFRWHVVIGVDTMGENMPNLSRDNVVIFADPCDNNDHYQDGYSVSATSRFYKWWLKQGSTTTTNVRECICIKAPAEKHMHIHRESEDIIKREEGATTPERQLLLNSDGSFGGTLDYDLYGCVEELNGYVDYTLPDCAIYEGTGSIEHTDYNYYAYPDYYNMESTSSRKILHNFRAFEQTEASSCGICSVMETLDYYGFDWTSVHTSYHIKNRAKLFNESGKKPGSKYNYWHSRKTTNFEPITNDQNELKQEACTLIYMNQDSAFDNGTKLFNNYGGVGSSKLKNVPTQLWYGKDSSGNSQFYKATSSNSGKYHGLFPTYEKFKTFVLGKLNTESSICTGWCPVAGHWTTIIGFDDMGTDYIYDDVIIIADSHDISDHYQDGYNTYPATVFWGQWRNGGGSVFEQYVAITNPKVVNH